MNAAAIPISETNFQAQVVELANLLGWRDWHDNDSRRNKAGFPDLVLVRPGAPQRPGRVIFAELKKQTGRASKAQQEWLSDLYTCPGVETYLWRPSDWDAIVAILQREA